METVELADLIEQTGLLDKQRPHLVPKLSIRSTRGGGVDGLRIKDKLSQHLVE